VFQVRRWSQLIDINEWPQRSERDCWSEVARHWDLCSRLRRVARSLIRVEPDDDGRRTRKRRSESQVVRSRDTTSDARPSTSQGWSISYGGDFTLGARGLCWGAMSRTSSAATVEWILLMLFLLLLGQ